MNSRIAIRSYSPTPRYGSLAKGSVLMDEIIATTADVKRMQSELLAERVAEALENATLTDQSEARDAKRYATRIEFALGRVNELRTIAQARQSVFEDARLDVALTILETHVVQAACFIDRIARRQRSELAQLNRKIAGETADAVDFENIRTIRAA